MNYRTPLSLLLVILLLVVVGQSFYVVPQGAIGVVRRLQSIEAVGLAPGLHLKLPFLDETQDLDTGGIALDSDNVSGGYLKFTSADGMTLETSYFAVWRIRDIRRFCAATACDETEGARRLDQLVTGGLHDALLDKKFDVAMHEQARVGPSLVASLDPAAARLGVSFDRIDLTGISLPAASLDGIYAHMRSAAELQAAAVKAAANAAAARSRAATDAEQARVLGAADAEVAHIRAGGEAEAAGLYTVAARQEPDFFAFYQGLASYRRSLAGQTVWVLDPSSPFLKYLAVPAR